MFTKRIMIIKFQEYFSRCSQVGQDLNRNWSKISKWMHPTVHAAYSYISSLDQDKVGH